MHRLLILLIFGGSIVVYPSAGSAQEFRCNSYLWELCYLVSSGDAVTVHTPADFVITEIQLGSGGHVTSYEGIGLADPDGSGGPVQVHAYSFGDVAVEVFGGIVPTLKGQYYSIHYGSRGNQIFGWFATEEEQRNVVALLQSFHLCRRGEPNYASVVCEGGPIFAEVAEIIGEMEPQTAN